MFRCNHLTIGQQKNCENRLLSFAGPETGTSPAEQPEQPQSKPEMATLSPEKTESLNKAELERSETVTIHEAAEEKERSLTLPIIGQKIDQSPDHARSGNTPKTPKEDVSGRLLGIGLVESADKVTQAQTPKNASEKTHAKSNEEEKGKKDEKKEGTEKSEEKEKKDTKNPEQLERQLREADQFISSARETLKEPYQKEIFDAALKVLTPEEKVAYYHDEITWFDAVSKNSEHPDTSNYDKSFASIVVFGRIKSNNRECARAKQCYQAVNAEYQLNASSSDTELADQAAEKIYQAKQQYLQEHPEIAKTYEQQKNDREQRFHERGSNTKLWEGGKGRGPKSPEQMKKDAAKELDEVIKKANGKKGIRFELLPASEQNRETGQELSLRIIPKDQNQSVQIQDMVRKAGIGYAKEIANSPDKAEKLKVTNDALTLKILIAETVSHRYKEKKIKPA